MLGKSQVCLILEFSTHTPALLKVNFVMIGALFISACPNPENPQINTVTKQNASGLCVCTACWADINDSTF